MHPNYFLGRVTAALAAALFLTVIATHSGFSASEFEGTWKVQDTKGNPFEITLSADGTAKGDRAGEGLTGKWEANEKRAVIKWDTGWRTKIVKQGDKYQKKAFEEGKKEAVHTSDAEKAQ